MAKNTATEVTKAQVADIDQAVFTLAWDMSAKHNIPIKNVLHIIGSGLINTAIALGENTAQYTNPKKITAKDISS